MSDGLTRAVSAAGVSSPWDSQQVDIALWELAKVGGSTRKAARVLAENHALPIPEATLRLWKDSSKRNRYSEILDERAQDLDELIAGDARALAVRMAALEEKALKATERGLMDADGVEAATILHKVSMAKAVQVDKSGAISGRPTHVVAVKTMGDLERIQMRLAKLGAATISEGDVEEVEDCAIEGSGPSVE